MYVCIFIFKNNLIIKLLNQMAALSFLSFNEKNQFVLSLSFYICSSHPITITKRLRAQKEGGGDRRLVISLNRHKRRTRFFIDSGQSRSTLFWRPQTNQYNADDKTSSPALSSPLGSLPQNNRDHLNKHISFNSMTWSM